MANCFVIHTPVLWSVVILQLLNIKPQNCLDNGLARTPPMGWMSWERYRCQIDCNRYPNECISEKLIQRTVDRLVEDGWGATGYRYVMIDDCWQELFRDRGTTKIVASLERFPNGIGAVGDYIHSKGLLFGIYLDYGTQTCEGYPGSMNYLEIDAKSLAEWKVDYVKVDGCYSPQEKMPGGYEELGRLMNQTGRPIVYSCSYPAYIDWRSNHSLIDWDRLQRNCNLWRMYDDVQDSWRSVLSILNVYVNHNDLLKKIAGPGHWNDPDMLVLGNFGLSKDQQRVQMGMWCMLAAPLIISTDLDNIDPFSADLLKNARLLAIDQDAGGYEAKYIKTKEGVQMWSRKLTSQPHSWAIAFVNIVDGGGPIKLPVTLREMQLENLNGEDDIYYTLIDVFDGSEFGIVQLDERWFARVNPTGIAMYELRSNKRQFDYLFWLPGL